MKQNVASKIKELFESVIMEKGFSLWDITYGKEAGEMLLTVTVDCDKEISFDMLSELNEILNDILDQKDPIPDAYSLMLESAGAERPLRTDAHIEYAINKGACVELKLYKAVDGNKEFTGKILSYDGEKLTFEAEIKEEVKKQKGKTINKAKVSTEEQPVSKVTYSFDKKQISKLIAYV